MAVPDEISQNESLALRRCDLLAVASGQTVFGIGHLSAYTSLCVRPVADAVISIRRRPGFHEQRRFALASWDDKSLRLERGRF